MSSSDLGKSITGVQALQRKMETFEREVAALGTKVSQSKWSKEIETQILKNNFLAMFCHRELLQISHAYKHVLPLLHLVLSLFQTRELSNECLRLAATQSGSAARNVEDLMNSVQTAWEALQAATASRKRKLKASLELQKFLSSVSNSN